MKHCILFVDDNDNLRDSMEKFFHREGFDCRCVPTGEEALALVRQRIMDFSVALIDYHLDDMNGAQLIAQLREIDSDLTTIGFSDNKSDFAHNESLESGAICFINKGASDLKLLGVLHRQCQEYERRKKPLTLTTQSANARAINLLEMAGCSNHLAEISAQCQKYASSNLTVLIRGENGTGKEKVARAIHKLSPRKQKPFIAVNCGAIPKELIESELFGHEKGAFSGATQSKIGMFQAADHGTIFLDEIGELGADVQSVLLRVLQEKTITAVGSNSERKIDVRVIAATNAPLEEMVKQEAFRQDLFFRLNVLPIHIKPLRERPEDIPYLIAHFLDRINKDSANPRNILDADVKRLCRLKWSGNVRELENAISYLATISDGEMLDVSHYLERVPQSPSRTLSDARFTRPLIQTSEKFERGMIVKALQKTGSTAGAARDLGISRSTLRDRIKKLGIEIRRMR